MILVAFVRIVPYYRYKGFDSLIPLANGPMHQNDSCPPLIAGIVGHGQTNIRQCLRRVYRCEPARIAAGQGG
jgi:hypothetical protein